MKKNYPQKREVIFSSYNLEEMIQIAKNLNLKVIFSDLNYKTGCLDERNLRKKLNKNTLALVYTNMFNDYKNQLKIQNLCKKNKIIFIEDNAIYFDNYHLKKNKKFFSGTLGDYTLYSFNIMKNISGLYGGGISSNNLDFFKFNEKLQSNFKRFPRLIYLKQNLIFLILRVFSIGFIYNFLFFYIVKYAHFKQDKFLLKLFYPSLKFKKKKIPDYYYSTIDKFSKKLVFLQLNNSKQRKKNHFSRKENNKYYFNIFRKMKLKQVDLLNIQDLNYQNFLDFPILVKNKVQLNEFLLEKGFEVKFIHYKNCSKTFNIDSRFNKNAELFERKLICLPNHSGINKNYIKNISIAVKEFYSEDD